MPRYSVLSSSVTLCLEPRITRHRSPRSVILLADDDPFQAFARQNALARSFSGIERASSAAETFIKMDRPELADRLALIIVGLRPSSLTGPSFVKEVTERAPNVPVLVIGREGEIAPDYAGKNVHFLPRQASSQDIFAATCELLSPPLHRVA